MQIRTGKLVQRLALPANAGTVQELWHDQQRLVCLLRQEPAASEGESASSNPSEWQVLTYALPATRKQAEAAAPPQVRPSTEPSQPEWTASLGSLQQATALLVGEELFVATSRFATETPAGETDAAELLAFDLRVPPAERQPLREALGGRGPHVLLWLDRQLLVTSAQGNWEVFMTWRTKAKQPPSEEPSAEDPTKSTPAPPAGGLLRKVYSEQFGGPIQGAPALAKQRVYLRTGSQVWALGAIDTQRAVSDLIIALPDQAAEPTAELAEEPQPGSLQIIPAVQELTTGLQQNFQVLLFDQHGNFLQALEWTDLQSEWSAPGDWLPAAGQLQAPTELKEPQSARLRVRWQDLQTEAEVQLQPTNP